MTGTEDAWGERFAAFLTQAAAAIDLEDRCALLCALEDLTRTKEGARRLIRASRRTLFELEYAVRWAKQLLSEEEGGWRPWK